MRATWLLTLSLGLSAGACTSPPTATTMPTPATPAPLADATSESIGGIALGADAATVEGRLGPPTHKGPVEEMAATGEFVSDWTWADHGLHLAMAAGTADGAATVGSIRIEAPSALTTSRGVGIGTSRAEVERIYQAFLGAGREDGEPDTTSADSLIVGSIYGGTFFDFVDGKVTAIFVGAGAE